MRIIKIAVFIVNLCMCLSSQAQRFEDYFEDKTLRLDYVFTGMNRVAEISLDEMLQSDGWYGRRGNLDSLLLRGNGQINVYLPETNTPIYCQSFSTLFQEWQTTEEATRVSKSFQNVFLIPFPKQPVDVVVTLTDTHNKISAKLKHKVDPTDILIRKVNGKGTTPWTYLYKADDSKKVIDVAIVAEGYTADEMEQFEKDCRMAVDAYQSHEPFKSLKDKFNFIAVYAPSEDSGISIPHKGIWKNTALSSNYDTFYSERYLTTLRLKRLHDILSGIPYEHIIILANTENYGGGGVYNSYMMSSARNEKTRPVIVHEFGHSYAGLGDEYYYDDQYETMYPSDTEPWEPNITTLADFDSKWKDMLPKKTAIPTKPDGKDIYSKVGVYEGGGYQSKGVYRPTQECRMKINEAPVFCPVCDRAIRRITSYYTDK